MTWFRAAGIRAIKTMAQTAIALIGTSIVINDVDWRVCLSASILAGLVSMLTSIKGLPEVDEDATEFTRKDDDRKGE